VQISVSPTNLEGTKLTIKITIGEATNLRRIWLSWLAFSPSTASFGSYGGQVSQNKYSGSVSSDISNSLYQNAYTLYGLNLISLNAVLPIAFTSSIDSTYVLTISASATIDSFSLVYVSVGVLPGKQCDSCNNGLIANGNDCVTACPAGTFSHAYKDGGVACRTCSSKLGFILSGGKCVPGTVTTNTITRTTTVSAQIPTAPASAPAAPAAPVAPVTPAPVAKPPVVLFSPVCPPNSSFVGNECACDAGYVYLNGRCTLPAAPAVPLSVTPAVPLSVTPAPASTVNVASNVTTTTSTVSSTVNCGANSYDNGLGVCVCNTGSYFSNGACVVGAPCVGNAKRNADGTCSCEAGYTNFTGVCSKCPQGALWSSSANKCIWVCGQNSAYSASANACVCNPGYALLSGSCQSCPEGYFISNGYCVTCPINSAYNTATKNCDCLSGFFTNQFGICARRCGTNEVYNSATQTCSCVLGLGRINGVCQICPSGSTPTADGNACSTCKPN